MTTKIIGTGSFLPENIVTNEKLTTIVETSDEWISSRTGIKERRIVCRETTSGMASEAAKRAIEDAKIDPAEIDLIIMATFTPDRSMPCGACDVQKEIGAANATAFDLNAACSGFLFALNTAHAYIAAGLCRTALVMGAETLSKVLDWTDRGTCVLFGDGAGAAVVQASDTGIISMVTGADGTKGDVLTCDGRRVINPLTAGLDDVESGADEAYIKMNGQEVFKFAVKKVPESIEELLEKSGTAIEDVKYFILHQANKRIIHSVAKRLKVSEEKFPMNLDSCGNTSAASIPILLDEMNRKGLLNPGDKIVMSGFGGGLTWGAVILEW